MAELPVTQLVGQDGDDLCRIHLLNQCIVDDNVLLPGQAVKVGVGVGATLAAINDEELLQGELVGRGEFLNPCLERALVQWREFVEERLDEDGVGGGGEELQAGGKDPKIEDELVARLLDDL